MTNKERRSRGLYWDRAWKLVEGCTKVSPGCDNCWSESETVMRSNHPNAKISGRADVVLGPCEPFFSGVTTMREDNLGLPLRIQTPTVFSVWNDLFHENVTEDFRDRAYEVMAKAKHHTFLVLTKRAEALATYFEVESFFGHQSSAGFSEDDFPRNVWHGVTVEDQLRADERIPTLLKVPGKRFLSVEPMLGAIDLTAYFGGPIFSVNNDQAESYNMGIDGIVLGGESGPNASPMHTAWARSVRDQCAAAGVPFYFKQHGEWSDIEIVGKPSYRFSDGVRVSRVGKKKAGRTLDGRIHDEIPWGK